MTTPCIVDSTVVVNGVARPFVAIKNYSVPSCLLITRLMEGVPGEMISDRDLAEVCGYNTSPKNPRGYQYLMAAMSYCLANKVMWQRMRGEGMLKCVEAEEAFRAAKSTLHGIRKKSKVGMRQTMSKNISDLPRHLQAECGATQAALGVIAHMTSTTTTKKLEDQCAAGMVRFDSNPQSVIALCSTPLTQAVPKRKYTRSGSCPRFLPKEQQTDAPASV